MHFQTLKFSGTYVCKRCRTFKPYWYFFLFLFLFFPSPAPICLAERLQGGGWGVVGGVCCSAKGFRFWRYAFTSAWKLHVKLKTLTRWCIKCRPGRKLPSRESVKNAFYKTFQSVLEYSVTKLIQESLHITRIAFVWFLYPIVSVCVREERSPVKFQTNLNTNAKMQSKLGQIQVLGQTQTQENSTPDITFSFMMRKAWHQKYMRFFLSFFSHVLCFWTLFLVVHTFSSTWILILLLLDFYDKISFSII